MKKWPMQSYTLWTHRRVGLLSHLEPITPAAPFALDVNSLQPLNNLSVGKKGGSEDQSLFNLMSF